MSYIPPHQREGATTDANVNASDANVDEENITLNVEDAIVKDRIVSTTCVYVEYFPLNVTPEEIAHEFGQCGELAKDDAGKPRIKLYRHRDGTLKGDGLVNYESPEGAETAIQDMDGRPLRMYGDDDDDEEAMVVTMAFFENKEKKQRKPLSQPDSPREGNKQRRGKQEREWRDPAGSPQPQRVYERPPEDSYEAAPKRGKPKQTVDADGWETVGTARPVEEPVVQSESDVPSVPKVSLDKIVKPKVKHSTSVIGFDGSVQRGWGDDDSSDEEFEEVEAEPEVVEVEDIEGIDDMTLDMGGDTDSEDEEVKEQRRQEALAAKDQSLSKQKNKKQQKKAAMSKKELKELKQKQDEDFERLLSQAVADVNLAKAGSETPETGESGAESCPESVTPPESTEPVVLDKAQQAKAAKNKKRKEAAKRKKDEEERLKQQKLEQVKEAPKDDGNKAEGKKTLTPAEVLAIKKEKRAKKEAKLAKEKAEANARKMATQKRAKEARAKSVANYEQNKREKFHFSSENSSGCDAG